MTLKVIDYLRTKTLDDLESELGIKARRHKYFPNLVQLKYSQIDSPHFHPIVEECRGLILDENDNWKIISFSYRRFYNHDESCAANINWSSARLYDKLDGSLMTLYHYKDNWHVASSGLPDASGEVNGFGMTFADLFWKVWNELNYKLPNDTTKCYMMEMMTPHNRIVVRHKENNIVLHGVRDLLTLNELNPVVIGHLNSWNTIKVLPLKTLDEIVSAAEILDPINEGEGYVVVDQNYNRIKVKSSNYILYSKAKDSLSTRDILKKAVSIFSRSDGRNSVSWTCNKKGKPIY